jgi:hypothetical protein
MSNDKNNRPENNDDEHNDDSIYSPRLSNFTTTIIGAVSLVNVASGVFNIVNGDGMNASADFLGAAGWGSIYMANKNNKPDLERFNLSRIGNALLIPAFTLSAIPEDNSVMKYVLFSAAVACTAVALAYNKEYKMKAAEQNNDNNGPDKPSL